MMADAPRSSTLRLSLLALLVWGAVACFSATQMWSQLRGGGKDMSWWRAFGYQGVSWALLVIATPVLLMLVRRYPLDRAHRARVWWHWGASVVFGLIFLGAGVPLRLAFHPSPVRWTFFGEAYYKSAPLFVLIGIALYWLIVLIGSLLETRGRLYATLEPVEEPGDPSAPILTLNTPTGTAHWPAADVLWAEPAAAGARLCTSGDTLLVRHSMAELESMLTRHGFVRVHRSVLVNAGRVREVTGGASRDGEVRLDTGDTLPLSRRRREALRSALEGAPLGA